MSISPRELPQLNKLSRDLRKGARLSVPGARYLVDQYYAIQDFRMQAVNQERAAQDAGEPIEALTWMAEQFIMMEHEVQLTLGNWAKQFIPGRWARSIVGIGPVLSAGLVAHIDIEKAPYAGNIWSFAGIIPGPRGRGPELAPGLPVGNRWEKGQKRPWNAKLKVICWKISDSFVKVSGNPNDVYGKIYRERKQLELQRDAAGMFVEQAKEALEVRDIKDKALLATYRSGHLPAGRLDLRARAYAVKIFLAHYHHVAYESFYGTPPPTPFILTGDHGHHTTFLGPPNWPMQK